MMGFFIAIAKGFLFFLSFLFALFVKICGPQTGAFSLTHELVIIKK
jgi:hypothetical protein